MNISPVEENKFLAQKKINSTINTDENSSHKGNVGGVMHKGNVGGAMHNVADEPRIRSPPPVLRIRSPPPVLRIRSPPPANIIHSEDVPVMKKLIAETIKRVQNKETPTQVGKDGRLYFSHGFAIKLFVQGKRRTDPWMRSYEAELTALRLLRGKSHENICAMFGSYNHGNQYGIIVTEDAGTDLFELVDNGPNSRTTLDESQLKEVACQLTDAIAHLHSVGIAHRDIKPENIALDRSGTVRLIDFGLAKQIPPSGQYFRGTVGTPGYIAPEQWFGTKLDLEGNVFSISKYSANVDVFGLGAVLFALGTGIRPYIEPPRLFSNEKSFEKYVLSEMFLRAMKEHQWIYWWHSHISHARVLSTIKGCGNILGPSKTIDVDSWFDYVQTCMTYDGEKRPSSKDMLSHPFLYQPSGFDRKRPLMELFKDGQFSRDFTEKKM